MQRPEWADSHRGPKGWWDYPRRCLRLSHGLKEWLFWFTNSIHKWMRQNWCDVSWWGISTYCQTQWGLCIVMIFVTLWLSSWHHCTILTVCTGPHHSVDSAMSYRQHPGPKFLLGLFMLYYMKMTLWSASTILISLNRRCRTTEHKFYSPNKSSLPPLFVCIMNKHIFTAFLRFFTYHKIHLKCVV